MQAQREQVQRVSVSERVRGSESREWDTIPRSRQFIPPHSLLTSVMANAHITSDRGMAVWLNRRGIVAIAREQCANLLSADA